MTIGTQYACSEVLQDNVNGLLGLMFKYPVKQTYNGYPGPVVREGKHVVGWNSQEFGDQVGPSMVGRRERYQESQVLVLSKCT